MRLLTPPGLASSVPLGPGGSACPRKDMGQSRARVTAAVTGAQGLGGRSRLPRGTGCNPQGAARRGVRRAKSGNPPPHQPTWASDRCSRAKCHQGPEDAVPPDKPGRAPRVPGA